MSISVLPIDMAGRRVLVTAAGSGIGLTIAKAFRERGAQVYVCDVDASALKHAKSKVDGLLGSVVDVSRIEAVDAMVAEAAEQLQGLDILVNNAGIAGPTAAVEDVDPEAFQDTLRICLESQFLCARRAIPMIKAAGGGSIINLGSVASRLSFAMRTPYSAAKWGVIGFTKSLALEVGSHHINANAILPGHVNGDRFDRVMAAKGEALGISAEQLRKETLGLVALRSTVEQQDIANIALYLASPFGAMISGQAISVCGGVEAMR
ncbi:SDR family oxidoreductase [Aminobacter sp. MSH1]|uniref:SDR family oxidoreductase n=1 Tax=Aminobacter sp. MSH1 TaxID=374606 RepID=UPI001901BF7A|nr:SDR family oxidoreductase [Aminobacter sp. MSH1]